MAGNTKLSYVLLYSLVLYYNNAAENAAFIPNSLQLFQKKLFDDLFYVYNGFSVILHIENSTNDEVNHLLKAIHEHVYSEVMVINHDTFKFASFLEKKRASFLNIILLRDVEKYLQFITVPERLSHMDVVFFIILDESIMDESFWKSFKLAKAGNTIIYDMIKESLYYICYYCGATTGKLNYVFTNNTITELMLELRPHRFNNFNGHHFHVGYIQSFPKMFCSNSTETLFDNVTLRICHESVGVEFEILKILSRKLHFTYDIRAYQISMGNLHRQLNLMQSRIYDFIIGGISITYGRASQMSFSYPINIEPYNFLYIPRKLRGSEFFDSLKPFDVTTWLFVFTAIVSFSLALYYSTIGSDGKPEFTRTACFLVCFKATIEQVEKVKIKSTKTRFRSYTILGIWWFASLVIATAYKSKLWAISIQNYNIEPSNLEQLLESDYEIVASIANLEIKEDILNKGNPLTAAALKKLVYCNDTCQSIQYIVENKAAILSEYGYLQYHMLFTCGYMLKPAIYSKLRLTSQSIHQTSHAWPLPRGAPFKNSFDVLISRIESTGLRSKWKSDCLANLRTRYSAIPYSKTTTSYPDFEDKYFLKGFRSAFALYVFGNVAASICFCAEMFAHKRN